MQAASLNIVNSRRRQIYHRSALRANVFFIKKSVSLCSFAIREPNRAIVNIAGTKARLKRVADEEEARGRRRKKKQNRGRDRERERGGKNWKSRVTVNCSMF